MAKLVVGAPKSPGAKELKEKFALWITLSQEADRNRAWSWEEVSELFDRPHNLTLAGVLRAFGWWRQSKAKYTKGCRVRHISWFPPSLPPIAPITRERVIAVLESLPKEPVKVEAIFAGLGGGEDNALLDRTTLFALLKSLGWRRWRDGTSDRWWLAPDVPTPKVGKPGRKPKPPSTEPKRPRGRPRKQPFPISEQSS